VNDDRPDAEGDETALRRTPQTAGLQLGLRALNRLDIFWPILAVILVTAVIFVATVAHNSMNTVGSPVTQTPSPARRPISKATPIMIVQVSSHPTKAAAERRARRLDGQGFHTHILHSDDYRPMNRGFYVVYTGPYPDSTKGRSEAKQVKDTLDGALLRTIQIR
jgi:hypothetical protein